MRSCNECKNPCNDRRIIKRRFINHDRLPADTADRMLELMAADCADYEAAK